MLHKDDELRIVLETNEPPYMIHGTFIKEEEEAVMVKGTVGDSIGYDIIIPKSRIKIIEVVKRVSDKRREYDEAWRGTRYSDS